MAIHHHSPTRSAFSLLEVLIVTAIMATVVLVTSQTMNTGSQVHDQLYDRTTTSADASRILHDIAMELRGADDDFLYDTSNPDEVIFSYSRCTGIDTDTGAAIYGDAGKVTVTFTRATGRLSKVEGVAPNDFETALAEDVTAFTVDSIATDGGGTVYGNRLQLTMTMMRNVGETDEVEVTTDRTVFLRSHLFNSDGLTGSEANSSGESDPNAEPPPPTSETTGPKPPTMSWGPNTGTNGQLLVVVTISDAGGGTSVDPNSIAVSFPEGDTGITASDPVETSNNSGQYEVTLQGDPDGSAAIQIYAEAAKNNGSDFSTTTETNWF